MSTVTSTVQAGDARRLTRSLLVPAVGAGLLGGAAFLAVMMAVMGADGMGYASPVSLGLPAFVYTIRPPASMFPQLMGAMGIHLPASMMGAIANGSMSPAMMQQKLGPMLMSMHLPASTVSAMGQLMSGHATNAQLAGLMQQMTPSARASVMQHMPVLTSHVVAGSGLHFAFAAFLGVVFVGLITAAAWFKVPGLRTSAGIVGAGVIGGALLYVVMRWVLLPPTNPLMALVPQTPYFLAHLLFGLIVGSVLALALRRRTVRAALPAVD